MQTLQIIVFIINCCALCFILIFVSMAMRRMERKLNATIDFMRWVKSRNDTTYIEMLYHLQSYLIEQERYEEAVRVKKIIEEEMADNIL